MQRTANPLLPDIKLAKKKKTKYNVAMPLTFQDKST